MRGAKVVPLRPRSDEADALRARVHALEDELRARETAHPAARARSWPRPDCCRACVRAPPGRTWRASRATSTSRTTRRRSTSSGTTSASARRCCRCSSSSTRSGGASRCRGSSSCPETGAGLIVANHSGVLPYDGLMVNLAVRHEHPARRTCRMLALDMFALLPFLAPMLSKSGAVRANPENAERLLRKGELVGVFPEGVKGVGKPFKKRYRLARFGRGGFVRIALRTGAPILPCAVVGAEEIHPMVGQADFLGKPFGLPYFPITPTFPLLGPLGLVPAAVEVVDRVRRRRPHRHLRPRRRRRSHPRQPPVRAGARHDPADDRRTARAAPLGLVRLSVSSMTRRRAWVEAAAFVLLAWIAVGAFAGQRGIWQDEVQVMFRQFAASGAWWERVFLHAARPRGGWWAAVPHRPLARATDGRAVRDPHLRLAADGRAGAPPRGASVAGPAVGAVPGGRPHADRDRRLLHGEPGDAPLRPRDRAVAAGGAAAARLGAGSAAAGGSRSRALAIGTAFFFVDAPITVYVLRSAPAVGDGRAARAGSRIGSAAWYAAAIPYFAVVLPSLFDPTSYLVHATAAARAEPPGSRASCDLVAYNLTPWRWSSARPLWFPREAGVVSSTLARRADRCSAPRRSPRSSSGRGGPRTGRASARARRRRAGPPLAVAANAAYASVVLSEFYCRTHLLSRVWIALLLAAGLAWLLERGTAARAAATAGRACAGRARPAAAASSARTTTPATGAGTARSSRRCARPRPAWRRTRASSCASRRTTASPPSTPATSRARGWCCCTPTRRSSAASSSGRTVGRPLRARAWRSRLPRRAEPGLRSTRRQR